ncbi:hypothetical protein [Nafulsella turpanensis]|uniref:hypothetical protein n=1 Tax=Nafulsella turpanensis TaxID=1265690 RepID=UPI000381BA56|nr:hypothetical protein [Nafulsella turpanensis]
MILKDSQSCFSLAVKIPYVVCRGAFSNAFCPRLDVVSAGLALDLLLARNIGRSISACADWLKFFIYADIPFVGMNK